MNLKKDYQRKKRRGEKQMDKKEIKISLGTFIIVIIAIILLTMVVCIGIYIMNINKKQTEEINQDNSSAYENTTNDKNITNNNTVENNISKEVDNSFNDKDIEEKIEIKLGTYRISNYSIEVDPQTPEMFLEDEYIKFLDNNEFEAYMGWGDFIYGHYATLKDGTIKCNLETWNSDFMYPNQDKIIDTPVIVFKSKKNNTIEVIEASSGYEGRILVSNGNNEYFMSNETNIFSIFPFEPSATFVLDKQ